MDQHVLPMMELMYIKTVTNIGNGTIMAQVKTFVNAIIHDVLIPSFVDIVYARASMLAENLVGRPTHND